MAETRIRYEDDGAGGRLVYYRSTADAAYWDDLWDESDVDYRPALRGKLSRPLNRAVARWVPKGGRVLEAGCGPARFTLGCHSQGLEAVGLDWAPRVLQRLREKFPGVTFDQGDVRELPYTDGHFDAVYSPGVCEHFLEGPDEVLLETFRVLRHGGVALVTTPYLNPLRQRLHERGQFRDDPDAVDFYQYAFSGTSMHHALERCGFKVVWARPYSSLKTLRDHRIAGFQFVRSPFGRPASFVCDWLPPLSRWGHSCLWVAQRP